jgi:membrane-associated protease RseP (regulator of RpoE activity)
MSNGDRNWTVFLRVVPSPQPTPQELLALAARPRRRSAFLALGLFLLTVLSTLTVGAEFTIAYEENRAPFSEEIHPFGEIWENPSLLLFGLPFSFTLLGILGAHELGHYFACRYYGIAASYPYFIPAPTIFGTFGAFIRIRSPIINRKALFDVGIAGPVVGFLFALSALAIAIAYSKPVPQSEVSPAIIFGEPLLSHVFIRLFHPGISPSDVFLHPVGRAVWVGLFATAINLLPAGQLDGGHILYALASEKHRRVTFFTAIGLAALGKLWAGWWIWAVLLLLLGFRHPPLLDRWEPLDAKRRAWAIVALLIFVLCFMPIPARVVGFD